MILKNLVDNVHSVIINIYFNIPDLDHWYVVPFDDFVCDLSRPIFDMVVNNWIIGFDDSGLLYLKIYDCVDLSDID